MISLFRSSQLVRMRGTFCDVRSPSLDVIFMLNRLQLQEDLAVKLDNAACTVPSSGDFSAHCSSSQRQALMKLFGRSQWPRALKAGVGSSLNMSCIDTKKGTDNPRQAAKHTHNSFFFSCKSRSCFFSPWPFCTYVRPMLNPHSDDMLKLHWAYVDIGERNNMPSENPFFQRFFS